MLGIRARAMWCVLLVLPLATLGRPWDTGAQSVSGSIAGTVADEQGAGDARRHRHRDPRRHARGAHGHHRRTAAASR